MAKETTLIGINLPGDINEEIVKYQDAYTKLKEFKSKEFLCIKLMKMGILLFTQERKNLETTLKNLP